MFVIFWCNKKYLVNDKGDLLLLYVFSKTHADTHKTPFREMYVIFVLCQIYVIQIHNEKERERERKLTSLLDPLRLKAFNFIKGIE